MSAVIRDCDPVDDTGSVNCVCASEFGSTCAGVVYNQRASGIASAAIGNGIAVTLVVTAFPAVYPIRVLPTPTVWL